MSQNYKYDIEEEVIGQLDEFVSLLRQATQCSAIETLFIIELFKVYLTASQAAIRDFLKANGCKDPDIIMRSMVFQMIEAETDAKISIH